MEENELVRLDHALVAGGHAKSRTLAQKMIEAGQVFLQSPQATDELILQKKSSRLIDPREEIIVKNGEANRYVSRGGLKLEGALKEAGLDVWGLKALDVGISTGGFADCLLQKGARFIVGIDIGHNQLDERLKGHPQLDHYEGVNARDLSVFGSSATDLEGSKSIRSSFSSDFDIICIDVSFISLTYVLPEVVKFLKPGGKVMALVKPQFELQSESLNKKGVVKDVKNGIWALGKIKRCIEDLGLSVLGEFDSPIFGKEGNKEYFVYAELKGKASSQ